MREGRHGHDLDRHQEEEQRAGLCEKERGAVDRGQQQSVHAALLPLRRVQARHPDHGREQQRHPEHAGRQRAVQRIAVEPEVEQHVDREREERHGGHRLLGAQLDAQVLAEDRRGGADHE